MFARDACLSTAASAQTMFCPTWLPARWRDGPGAHFHSAGHLQAPAVAQPPAYHGRPRHWRRAHAQRHLRTAAAEAAGVGGGGGW